jgi:hypothetical protein
MREIHPLFAGTTIFLISLFAAFITFGLLKSTGAITDEKIQLGGAAAGFIIIFVVFSRFYSSQMDKLFQTDIQFNLFPAEQALNVKFDWEKSGTYKIINKNEETIKKGDVRLEIQPGGLVWKPPARIAADYMIIINLVEKDGKKWIVRETPLLPPTVPLHVTKGD